MARVYISGNIGDFTIELNVVKECLSVIIAKYTGDSRSEIIPNSFAGIPVQSIGDGAFSCHNS